MDLRQASLNELALRTRQLEEERRSIEGAIQKHSLNEEKAIESGDGHAVFDSRGAVAAKQEQLERLRIEGNAITRRIREYENHRVDAEKLKTEIEELHNHTTAEHVNRIIKAQNEIVESVREIQLLNEEMGNLAAQHRRLCGQSLDPPLVSLPWIVRELARLSQDMTHGLQPLEPFAFRKAR